MTTCAEWATRLADAEAALHTVNLGQRVEVIKSGEKSLTYGKSNRDDLLAYVRYLQGKVDACNGIRRSGRVLRFIPVDC